MALKPNELKDKINRLNSSESWRKVIAITILTIQTNKIISKIIMF